MNVTQNQVRLRVISLAAATTAAATGLSAFLMPAIDLSPAQSFPTLLSAWCSAVLLCCVLWAWLMTALVLTEALRARSGGPLPDRRRGVPGGYRRLVLSTCGLVLAAGATTPALATPGPVHLDSHATSLSSSTPTAAARAPMHIQGGQTPAETGTGIVVRSGDSLWRLSAERLPQDADDATIAHAWHQLYETNSRLIGDDPDRIQPGQRLTRPEGW